MYDLIVDEITHTEDNVEKDVYLCTERKSLVADLHEVIKLLTV